MAYVRKTRDYWSIQQYTGGQYGWEEVCAEETYKEARVTVREYRKNQPEYPARIRRKRERIEGHAPNYADDPNICKTCEEVRNRTARNGLGSIARGDRMSITWGSNKPTVSSRFWRGLTIACVWQAGMWLVIWYLVRHSSLWVKP